MYDLKRLSHMVLDEADSLLDDSFNVLLRGILKKMRIVSSLCALFLITYKNENSNFHMHFIPFELIKMSTVSSIYTSFHIIEAFIPT